MVVNGLIPIHEDASLLISRFQEYMEYDDVRYFVMKAVTESIGQVMQKIKEVMLSGAVVWVWVNYLLLWSTDLGCEVGRNC